MKTIWTERTDSTNSEALRRLGELPPRCVLAAREQTAGRGQRGNSWFSEPGKNLTFSIVLRLGTTGQPFLPASDTPWLNYLTATVVARFLSEAGVACKIKWPNDIYVGDRSDARKICGILIENRLEGKMLSAVVIGVGINVNQREFPQLVHVTSLSRCTGKEYDLEHCLDRLCALFEEAWPLLGDAAGRGRLFDAYSRQLFRKGEAAVYHDLLRDVVYTGVIEGVGPDGRLCVRDVDAGGQLRHYAFKEISYVL